LAPLNIKQSVNMHPDYVEDREIAPFIIDLFVVRG